MFFSLFGISAVYSSIDVSDAPSDQANMNKEGKTGAELNLLTIIPIMSLILMVGILMLSLYQIYRTFKEDPEENEELFHKGEKLAESTEEQDFIAEATALKEDLLMKLTALSDRLGELLQKKKERSAAAAALAQASKQSDLRPVPVANKITMNIAENFRWTQTTDEVELFVPVAADAQRGNVRYVLTPNKIQLTVRNENIIKGELFSTVIPEESTWVLDFDENKNRIIWISLQKTETAKNRQWQYVVKSEPKEASKTKPRTKKQPPPVLDDIDIDDYESVTNAIKALRK